MHHCAITHCATLCWPEGYIACLPLCCLPMLLSLQVVIRDILLGTPPECNGLLCEAFGPAANIDARLLIIAVAVLLCAPLMMLR